MKAGCETRNFNLRGKGKLRDGERGRRGDIWQTVKIKVDLRVRGDDNGGPASSLSQMKLTKIHSVGAHRDAKGQGYLEALILTETDVAFMVSGIFPTFEAANREACRMNLIVDENGMCGATINENEWACVSSQSRSLEVDVAQGAWRDGL